MSSSIAIEHKVVDQREGTPCLIDAVIDILRQCQHMIESLPDDSIYTAVSSNVPGSTIGKHVRHLCDHFRLLFEGLDNTPTLAEGVQHDNDSDDECIIVNYDWRSAKVPAERERTAAQHYITTLIKRAEQCATISERQPVRVNAVINSAGTDTVPLWSTWGRELWFCTHHAVHHHALIKAIAVEFNITLPYTFGLAPSTQRKEEMYKQTAS
ncbi:hypothetical protein BDF22DRAFT_733662 [Syncephalis plumigaleata]|nr:hypothetical protein BDF22DRAFT_733662 [Syncephalis plumigaleata]